MQNYEIMVNTYAETSNVITNTYVQICIYTQNVYAEIYAQNMQTKHAKYANTHKICKNMPKRMQGSSRHRIMQNYAKYIICRNM